MGISTVVGSGTILFPTHARRLHTSLSVNERVMETVLVFESVFSCPQVLPTARHTPSSSSPHVSHALPSHTLSPPQPRHLAPPPSALPSSNAPSPSRPLRCPGPLIPS